MKFPRLPVVAKFTALAAAIVWGVGIALTVISFNRHNPAGYSPRDHFISELGLPGTSGLNGLFNATEAVGSLLAVPVALALADRVRSKAGRRAVALAITAFLAASALGWMGLLVDLLRPEHMSTAFLAAHFSAAIACFGFWFAAVTLFAVDFARQPAEAGLRFLVVVGTVSGAAAVLLFAASLVAVLRLPPPSADPAFRAILQSRATPQMFNACIDSRRAGFTSVSTMEWTLWATMVLWLGSAVALLGNETPPGAKEESGPVREAAVARWISIVGHPFTFVVLLLVIPFLRAGQLGALRVAGVVAVAGLVPLGFFMRQRFRSGRWLTVDASAPRDRPVAYLAAFAVLVPVTLYFSLVEHSRILVDGALVIGAMMAIALAANRWIKGSGHMAFAAFSAVVFTRVAPLFAVGVTVFIPLLAWSRVRMRRHSVVEVVGGCALGACAGCVMLFLY